MTAPALPCSTIKEASAAIQSRKLSVAELITATLARIDAVSPKINDYITVMAEQATQAAHRLDAEVAAGRYRGPLHGIPVSLKDLYATRGVRTTSGSKILADHAPDFDSTVAARLEAAGAIIIGKNNRHEFAMGATNVNPHYGPARNPWDTSRIPGGSSGGTGASVSAGTTLAGMGTDTGGSVRIPSAVCGNVGLKATYGRVSRYGITTLSWSLDHPGPHTRCVWDSAAMLTAIAGLDPYDTSTSALPVIDYTTGLEGVTSLAGLRVGVPRNYFWEAATDDVIRTVQAAIRVLEDLGARVTEVTLPTMEAAPGAGNAISWSEAAAWHREWISTRPQDYGADVRERLEVGARILATQYHDAQRIRRIIREEVRAAFQQVDVIVTPSTPTPATPIENKEVEIGDRHVRVLRHISRFSRPFNVTGSPAITVPCGFSGNGLPIGLQVVGRDFDEATVLQVAHACEQATPWHNRWPEL